MIHIYAALDLTFDEENTDADEFVEKKRIPFKQAIEMVHSGDINDGKTICCLLRAERFLKEQGKI